jgi:squalene synthase HpnC
LEQLSATGAIRALPPTVRDGLAPVADLAAAQAFTRQLTNSHYENFSVVSRFVPGRLRQDFCNVYAFCRIADDAGDEAGDPQTALVLLARLKEQTRACFAGECSAAMFVALRDTVNRHELPIELFLDLIDAFEQDQRVTRYQDFPQLLDYCRRSANPVGRLVLYLCGYRDARRMALSDQTCSALQLINFWQDVRRDILERDRIYIPRESLDQFGVSEEQIRDGRCDDNYRQLMRFELERTERMFAAGDALPGMLGSEFQKQISLFSRGGRAILEAVRRRNYDTLTGRPALSKWQKGKLVMGLLWGAA